ncbi:MAG: alpha/beta fold hydrolase [Rhizobiaceae bacterium]|nr:alpha/beta fold hydrolase [Rhizobiaceae bacterium]
MQGIELLKWDAEKFDWPNASVSRFVHTQRVCWHVQRLGSGTKLLLLHGSGATTHSFEGLIKHLKDDFEILTVDLPGHGFSSELKGSNPSLTNVAKSLAALLDEESFETDLVIGHSAGAAIAVEMIAQDYLSAKGVVAINPAFYPFPGFAGSIFPAMARLLFLNPLVPSLFSIAANKSRVSRLMESTGSQLTLAQLSYYERAFASVTHIRGTLAMMASWDLQTLQSKLQNLIIPMLLLVGENDGTVDPKASLNTERLVADCDRILIPRYGHLLHEENPEAVSIYVRDFWSRVGK